MKSRIFTYGGEAGVFCGDVEPGFRHTAKKRTSVLICPIGPVFRLYHVEKGLRFMSQSCPMDSDIRCIAVDSLRVFAADSRSLCSFHLSKQIERRFEKSSQAVLKLLLPFGETLVGVDDRNLVTVWEITTGQIAASFQFDQDTFDISTAVHPATYVNKVVFGSHQGQLRLINTRTGKLLYTFKGWDGLAVSCLEQSTAVDVIAVGLRSGDICLHDIRQDETLLRLKQDFGPVTTMAFRSDGPPHLISGSPDCDLTVWDLEKQRIVHQEEKCHGDSGAKLLCLYTVPNEPLLVSASSQNCIKSWIFDQPDDSFRLYHSLQGHNSSPTLARFHGTTDELVISTGAADSAVKLFSTSKLTKYYNMGTAGTIARKTAKKRGLTFEDVKLGPVSSVASDTARESGWDNVVCTHKGDVRATTWSTRKIRRGSHLLVHDRFKSEPNLATAVATCCCVTACGNFTLIGYSSGHVDLYNIQSGKHRGSLAADQERDTAHYGSLVGVATDALNTSAITAGADSQLKWWGFLCRKKRLHRQLTLSASPMLLRLHRESRLAAVVLSDLTLIVVEIGSGKVVRSLPEAHDARITDVCFSASGYWVLSASADCTVKVWDIPSGQLVDVLLCPDPCTSLNMSPTDSLLVTTHARSKGLTLWMNRTLFDSVSLAPIDNQALHFDDVILSDALEEMDMEEKQGEKQQIGKLLTVSNLPPSRWANLMNLDLIRERNKPKEPPKKPKAAPFFLPTLTGLDPKFDLPQAEKEPGSKVLGLSAEGFQSNLCKSLISCSEDFEPPFLLLKGLGPSRIESEIESVGPTSGGSLAALRAFFKMIAFMLDKGTDVDLAESYLSVALRLHRNAIIADAGLRQELDKVKSLTAEAWESLDFAFDTCSTLIQYLGSALLS